VLRIYDLGRCLDVIEVSSNLFCLGAVVKQVLTAGESKDVSARVIAINNSSVGTRNIQTRQVPFEYALIPFLQGYFVFQLHLDDFCLLLNSAA
jgi:hypothetical protein